jgi:integrase/recombinase XerD
MPSSVRRRLYAIRKAHRLLALPDPTWEEDINLTLRRVRRAKGMTRGHLDKCLAA